MRVAAESLVEAGHLFMNHRMHGDRMLELAPLRRRRQVAVVEQIAGLEEVTMLRQLIDGIPSIEKHAFIAIDEGDIGLAGGGRSETRIVCKDAGIPIEMTD